MRHGDMDIELVDSWDKHFVPREATHLTERFYPVFGSLAGPDITPQRLAAS